jgi:hypothetical protein
LALFIVVTFFLFSFIVVWIEVFVLLLFIVTIKIASLNPTVWATIPKSCRSRFMLRSNSADVETNSTELTANLLSIPTESECRAHIEEKERKKRKERGLKIHTSK